jgi:hypothetical protein
MYEEHLKALEHNAWTLESIPWGKIDRTVAIGQPDILEALHDAALIEGYLPVYIPRLMALLRDDVDATAILSLELYEGLKHYTALKRYLDSVGHAHTIVTEQQLVDARRRSEAVSPPITSAVSALTHFMGSEHFAGWFFLRLSQRSTEPVLRGLLEQMSRDERRHAKAASDLLKARIRVDPAAAHEVLESAAHFRHYGNDVVEVPLAEPNDLEAIVGFNNIIRRLCGTGIDRPIDQESARADQ